MTALRRRSRLVPSRRRPGLRAAARRRAGGPRAVGRPSQSVVGWAEVKRQVWGRAGGRCEVVLAGARCPRLAVDPDHVRRRSAGGNDDADNIAAVCRQHHRQRDMAYGQGRLIVRALGRGQFAFALVVGRDKFAVRATR